MKNVLVVGNGYDIAHGLKTKYSDFMEFIKSSKFEVEGVPGSKQERLRILCETNSYIKYFYKYTENIAAWVDFENELRNINDKLKEFIEHISNYMVGENKIDINRVDKTTTIILECFDFIYNTSSTYIKYIIPNIYNSTYGLQPQYLKKYMRSELDGLKEALIIYLEYYMPWVSNNTEIKYRQLAEIRPEQVISFNYTDTYKRYGIDGSKVVKVHGSLDDEKIVLGYEDEDDKDLFFIQYKKYFQRIQYALEDIDECVFGTYGIQSDEINSKEVIAHFYGLSMDKTDEDLIQKIYENSKKIVVYYYVGNQMDSKDTTDYEQKVINLIDILGKGKFLDALGCKRITFEEIKFHECE